MFNSITAATLQPVLDGVKELFPVIVPTVVGFLALRKGWRFLKGEIASA